MTKFGRKLRQQRESKEIKLRHLAAQLDIDSALLSKIETGARNAPKRLLPEIAKILEMDYDKLLLSWEGSKVYYSLQDQDNIENILKEALQIYKSEKKLKK